MSFQARPVDPAHDRRPLFEAGQRSVCLITPPSAFLLDERVFVSLGVLKVAASLEAGGCRVNLLDLSGVENFLSASRRLSYGPARTVPSASR